MKNEKDMLVDLNEDADSWEAIENELHDMQGDEADKADKDKDGRDKGESRDGKKKKDSFLREALSWVVTFSHAILLALFLKEFVIINATVPTSSMENTIMTGDDLFGFRLSYAISEPKRGDIIIFKYPDDKTQKFVKRIIGLPGETIKIEDAKIYVDGELLEEDYLKEAWVNATGPYEFQVPEDSYLVLGDNRNNSLDARFWTNTYVTKDDIIGKAIFVYFPFDRIGMLD